jgi:hypothetical protein
MRRQRPARAFPDAKMTSPPQEQSARSSRRGVFFGVPLGELGFFSSLLMALAAGFLSFFIVTFVAIFAIMIYNGFGHSVNYADSYKLISFPIGCLSLVASLTFFGILWLRRKLSRG